MFVPVGVNYDRVLEAETLTQNVETDFRGRGARFVLGSFFSTAFLNLKYAIANRETLLGTASASFGSPISFKDWLEKNNVDFRNLEKSERFKCVEHLGKDIMAEISNVIPALPVPIIANVICRANRPINELEIKADTQRLIDELVACGVHVVMLEGSEDAAVDEALQALFKRDLVHLDNDGLVTINPKRIKLLRFYANSIAHFPPANLAAQVEVVASEIAQQ